MRLFYILILIILPLVLLAQVPFKFNYQGVARDGQGDPLGNRDISLLISIVKGSQEGIIEFSEQHFIHTAENGLFSLKIGNGQFITGNLRNIDWSIDDYFVRTEIDVDGGENYTLLGTSQLYAVPYALFALKAANAGDSGSAGTDDQTLSLSGTELRIEDGNSVDLSAIQDGVQDADADPNNEIQSLSISGSQLSISDGNTVELPSNGTGNSESPWQKISDSEINFDGTVMITEDLDKPAITLLKNAAGSGLVNLKNQAEDTKDGDLILHSEFGVYSYDKDGQQSFWLGSNDETGDGFLDIYQEDAVSITLNVGEGNGRVTTMGPNGNRNVSMNVLDGAPNNGFVSLIDEQGDIKSALYVAENQAGRGYLRGPNGNRNVGLNNLAANSDHGYVSVADAQGDNQAGLYVDADGQGVIFADIKNFRTPHPIQEDSDIVYASLEGPEAAAYMRGTGHLAAGSADIGFPDHFQHIISAKSITVILTPLSSDSKGLAVVHKSDAGFKVQELWQGTGDYAFDWEVKAVRSGFENYQVIRKKEYSRSADQLVEDIDRPGSINQVPSKALQPQKN